jgi:hypothetical protein
MAGLVPASVTLRWPPYARKRTYGSHFRMTELAGLLSIDTGHRFGYISKNQSLPAKDADRVMPGGEGQVRCPRAGRYSLLPGGPGIMPAGITTGARGASLQVGAVPAA